MKVIVSGNKYHDDGGFANVYEGESLKDIYVQVAHNHSYRQFDKEALEDNEITLDVVSEDAMLEELSMTNGDGCDYITGMFIVEGDVHKLDI